MTVSNIILAMVVDVVEATVWPWPCQPYPLHFIPYV